MKQSFRYILIFVFFFMARCGQEEKKEQAQQVEIKDTVIIELPLVQPPFKGLENEFQSVQMDVDSGKTFFAANRFGSVIKIQPASFVDSVGNKLTGKITIRYREFHSQADIFLSGIPLNYNAAGMLKRFSTGGMFEIRALQNDKEVYLDSGKVITVNMASFADDGNYHAFYLDEKKNREWNYLCDLYARDNPKKGNLVEKVRDKVKELNIPLGPEYFAFNYMTLLDVYLNDQVKEITKNRADLTIQAKIKEYGVSWSDIYCYQKVDFMGNSYLASLLVWKKISKEPWPAWSKAATATIAHVKDNEFMLTLTPPKSPSGAKKYTIEALMPIKSLLATPAAQWRYKYNEALQVALREEMRMNLAADVFREIEVHDFGIYNVDKLMKKDAYVQVNATFGFDDSIEVKNDFMVYYISTANRIYVKYPMNEWNNITLTSDVSAKFFAIMPGNKIALCDKNDWSNLNMRTLKEQPGSRVRLRFNTLPQPITSRQDIIKILGLSDIPF
ncbi:MAG: hypothetical protein ACHQF2_08730 [Flavobacteriales bacterium]